jgi:hypothetical protein
MAAPLPVETKVAQNSAFNSIILQRIGCKSLLHNLDTLQQHTGRFIVRVL